MFKYPLLVLSAGFFYYLQLVRMYARPLVYPSMFGPSHGWNVSPTLNSFELNLCPQASGESDTTSVLGPRWSTLFSLDRADCMFTR